MILTTFVFSASSKFWEDETFLRYYNESGSSDLWEGMAIAESYTHRVIVLGKDREGFFTTQRACSFSRSSIQDKGFRMNWLLGRDWDQTEIFAQL